MSTEGHGLDSETQLHARLRWPATLDASAAFLVAAAGATFLWFRFNETPPALGKTFPYDLLYFFYPQMEIVGRRLAAGELPLWNPHGCAGLPLLAALQPAVFYPGTWLSMLPIRSSQHSRDRPISRIGRSSFSRLR